MGIIYDLAFIILAIFYIPVLLFRKRRREGLRLRLGLYPEGITARLKAHPKQIWVHAVSVGEVMAVSSLIAGLRNSYPGHGLVITTVTETGHSVAKNLARDDEIVLFLPFDISFVVKRVIANIRPALLIIAETELWPNLIRETYHNRAGVVLVNGRISEHSFRRYRLIRFMLGPILKRVSLFLMQTEADRNRAISLGADISRVRVCGNMKFDSAVSVTAPVEERRNLRALLNLKEDEKFFVAGSTHPGEEEIITNCYVNLKNRYKNLRLLIAPRHIERTAEVEAIAKGYGLNPLRISRICISTKYDVRSTMDDIFILDTIGQLKNFYSIADMVFIGGSLIKKGGQNMIEAAAFAKPILFGPHTFNFRDIASAFLKEEAAIMVKDRKGLEKAVGLLLEDPALCSRLGQKARRLVEENKGASAATLNAIREVTNKVQP